MYKDIKQYFSLAAIVLVSVLSYSVLKAEEEQQLELQKPLDVFFNFSRLHALNVSDVDKIATLGGGQKEAYFTWMDENKQKAVFEDNIKDNVEVALTILEGKIGAKKVEIDFRKNKFEGMTFYFSPTKDELDTDVKILTEWLNKELQAKYLTRNPRDGDSILGYFWKAQRYNAALTWVMNEELGEVSLRLRISPKSTSYGVYKSAVDGSGGEVVRISDLRRNLVKKGGDVFIGNFPILVQEESSLNVVANVHRLYSYYGIDSEIDQLMRILEFEKLTTVQSDGSKFHVNMQLDRQFQTLGKIFNTTYTLHAKKGAMTSTGCFYHPTKTVEETNTVTYRDYNTRQITGRKSYSKQIPLKFSNNEILDSIYSFIDDGIPVFYEYDRYQKFNTNPRVIVGYNKSDNQLIVSELLEVGQQLKKIDDKSFFNSTKVIFTLIPDQQ
ncbi:hypothetical protein OAB00_01580 [Akkermansiaceae bacterium]|nr:hypothetical protein [Akkermansiaceae bacterium]